jgi:hypothetical protein
MRVKKDMHVKSDTHITDDTHIAIDCMQCEMHFEGRLDINPAHRQRLTRVIA